MKKFLPMILLLFILTSCAVPGASQGMSDAEMATKVSMILTSMPTQTASPVIPTATPIVETPVEKALPVEPSATEVLPTDVPPTETPLPPTETPQPTMTSTSTPEPTFTSTALPLMAATYAYGYGGYAGDNSGYGGYGSAVVPTLYPSVDDPRNRLGPATSADPLDDAKAWNWPTGWDYAGYSAAAFQNGSMVITGLKKEAGWRLPSTPAMGDGYVEGTFRMGNCVGQDSYGIIFHVPELKKPDRGIIFSVSCDGSYRLWKWAGAKRGKGTFTSLIPWKQSAAIRQGPDQPNRVGVMTLGDEKILYINGYRVDQIKDDSYPVGYFGVMVAASETPGLTIYVDEMAFWSYPYQRH